MQRFDATMDNNHYVCGMQPLEPYNPIYSLDIARDGLECHDTIEFEFYIHPYNNAEWFKAVMCA